MKSVLWILHLYPRSWRERYEQEMLALLEEHAITFSTILDLLMGALDARLDPHYRRENMLFMFRERRSIIITFLLALAVTMGIATLWSDLISAPLIQTGTFPTVFNTIQSFTGWPALLCLALCVPLAALSAADEAHKRWPATTRCAAWISGTIFVGSVVWMFFSEDFVHTDALSQVLKPLVFSLIPLLFASLVFLLVITARKALAMHIHGTLSLTLLFLALSLVFVWQSASTGAFTVSAFNSWLNFIVDIGPTASFCALALFLATSSLDRKSFQGVLNVGTFLLCCVALLFLAGTGWTISTWVQAGSRLTVPHTGIWALFGGNWLPLFWLAALGGGLALLIAIAALIRGFQFREAAPLPDITS